MALRLTRVKGSKNWYVRGSVCGKAVFESTGLCDEKLAEAYRVNLESQIQDSHAFGKKESITFAEVAEMYLKAGGSGRYLVPVARQFAGRAVETLKQSDIDLFAAKLLPTQANATRDRQVYTPFIAVMNYAADNDYCSFRKWRRPKQQDKVRKPRFATIQEVAAMYDAAHPRIRPLIVLLAYSGLRMGEAINLKWDDVDLGKRWLVVRKAKNGKPRGVPLHRAVVRELTKLEHREGNVILSRAGKPYKYLKNGGSSAKNARDGAARRAGIGDITWHDFRHTCATWLQMAGIERETRQDILGHSRGGVHDTYVHVPSNAKLEAIDKLPDFTDFSRI